MGTPQEPIEFPLRPAPGRPSHAGGASASPGTRLAATPPPPGRHPAGPTFLLGPRRGHDEREQQVERAQQAGRGLHGGGARSSSFCSGSSRCPSCSCACSRPLLLHRCRLRAAELELERGPSRRGGGDGGGAGAVVSFSGSWPRRRTPQSTSGLSRARAPAVCPCACRSLWVRPCASVSVTGSRPPHRLRRRVRAHRGPRVKRGGRPYWRRARAARGLRRAERRR